MRIAKLVGAPYGERNHFSGPVRFAPGSPMSE